MSKENKTRENIPIAKENQEVAVNKTEVTNDTNTKGVDEIINAEAPLQAGRGMITRTFAGYMVTIMLVELDGSTRSEERFYSTALMTDGERIADMKPKILKKAAQEYLNRGVPIQAIYTEELRGMPMETFYNNSVPVVRPPSQSK